MPKPLLWALLALEAVCVVLLFASFAVVDAAQPVAPSPAELCAAAGMRAVVTEASSSIDDHGRESWTYSYECVRDGES